MMTYLGVKQMQVSFYENLEMSLFYDEKQFSFSSFVFFTTTTTTTITKIII